MNASLGMDVGLVGNPDTVAPTGTVTVVLGDVAGSTRLWQSQPEAMTAASRRVTEITGRLADEHRGHLPREQGEGDNFVAAFAVAADAVAFAVTLDHALAEEEWPDGLTIGMRLGIHTGDVEWDEGTGYLGPTFNRCARLRDLGHARMILLSQASRDIVADRLPTGHRLEDLGSHQLRDLSRAEHVFQLRRDGDDTAWPPLKSVSSLPNNLPIPVTSLVGRDDEIGEVGRLLIENRLVTLTGAGGSGKTRLAQHVASDVLQFAPDGAWWADLMPITEDDQVAGTIAGAARLAEAETIDQLVAAVGDARMLIVIDNCEHLIDTVADLVDALLHDCRHVRILATSRETLGIDGEQNFRVRPLGVPEQTTMGPTELELHDATRLFLDRARAVAPLDPTDDDAAAIATVCRRLDGIPLAIELAAARTRLLSPKQIADGLDDRFKLLTSGARRARSRQRTLEASVAWSFDLLDDDERDVLCRLGVLPTTFDLETAQAIGTLGQSSPLFLDVLTSLVEKSLVAVRPDDHGRRYRLLETIKQYAIDKLTEGGEVEAARNAHLRHVIDQMEAIEVRTLSEPTFNAPRQLRVWADDVRAAQAWAVATDQPDAIIGLHWPNYWSAVLLSNHRESIAALRPLVDDPRLDASSLARITAMLATFNVAMSDYATAADLVDEGLAQVRATGDLKALLGTLVSGTISLGMDRGEGVALGLEAMELARPLGTTLFATAGYGFGLCLEWASDRVEDHIDLLEEAHAAAHHSGIPELIVGMDGILYGHVAAAGNLIDTYEKMAATRAYAKEHAPRTLATWAILPGMWTWHWTSEHDEVLAVAHEAISLAGPPGSLSHTMALIVRATANYVCQGPHDTVLDDTAAAIERLRGSGADHWLTVALALRAAALHQRGDHAAARAALAEGREHLPRTGWSYARGAFPWAESFDPDIAPQDLIDGAIDVLGQMVAMGWLTGWAMPMLELAARTLHRLGETDRPLALLGASDAIFDSFEVITGTLDSSYVPGWRDEVRAEVLAGRTEADVEAGLAAGRALSLEQALTLLRGDEEAGSASAPRPITGWGSLTPAEVDVAVKVAEGLTNPQVAEVLFVSTNTVKTHLKSIYAKLAISSRAELATTVAAEG